MEPSSERVKKVGAPAPTGTRPGIDAPPTVIAGAMITLAFAGMVWMDRLVERLGFEFAVEEVPGWRIWNPALWENLFSWWLLWSFRRGLPVSISGKWRCAGHGSRARC